jgi:hypothetical protein
LVAPVTQNKLRPAASRKSIGSANCRSTRLEKNASSAPPMATRLGDG